jgi:hypothetical protein
MRDLATSCERATTARRISCFLLNASAVALLAIAVCFGAAAKQPSTTGSSSNQPKKPKLVKEAITLTSPNGLVVTFTPASSGSSALAKATIQSTLTADDVAPCIFQHGFGTCVFGDGRMATTDWGMGFQFNLDGITPSYRSEWKNTAPGVSRIYSVYFSSQCPSGYY